MPLLSDLYDISSRGNIRGKSNEGFVRPTIGEFFMSDRDFEEVENFITGPGPKTINYDSTTDTGYYGVVNSADLCEGSTLASDIGLSAGTLQYNDAGWLKFYVGPSADCNKDGVEKVLFIAKKTIRHSVSWDDIYIAGAVNGTNDNGPVSASDGTTVIQNAKVIYNQYEFKVRLLTGSATNPVIEPWGNFQCLENHGSGSEWNDLLYRVHVDVPNCNDIIIGMPGGQASSRHGGPQYGVNWANYTNIDLQIYNAINGTYCWCQEKGNNLSRRVHRGRHGIATLHTGGAQSSASDDGWRPVLELIQ